MKNSTLVHRAAWWDVVGMILTFDKRLFIVLPVLAAVGYFGGKVL